MPRNRALIVGRPKTGKMTLLNKLTGSYPEVPGVTHAGLTHHYYISNKYYSARIDIWVDEFGGEDQDSVSDWVETFCSDEAKEVRDALGAVIYTFDPSKDYESELKSMGRFVEKLEEEMWDGVCIAAGTTEGDIELALTHGFELIDMAHEHERLGEALETFPWDSDELIDHEEADNDEEDNWDDIDFDNMTQKDKEDVAKVLTQLSYDKPMIDNQEKEGGSELDVENLDKFMEKLQLAQQDKSMSKDDRKKLSHELAAELLNIL